MVKEGSLLAARIRREIGEESRKREAEGGIRKVTVERVERIGILKFIREISSWESILFERRFERKERLEICLRSARLER
jgi:hypothetical protein